MSNCTFKYIEDQFRETDPDKADYLNNLSLDTWSKLKNSGLFKEKTEGTKTLLYLNNPNTKKRQNQNQFISDINQEIGTSIVNVSDKNFLTVDMRPLFDTFSNEDYFISFIKNVADKNNVDLTQDNCK